MERKSNLLLLLTCNRLCYVCQNKSIILKDRKTFDSSKTLTVVKESAKARIGAGVQDLDVKAIGMSGAAIHEENWQINPGAERKYID